MSITGVAPVGAGPQYAKMVRGVLGSELGTAILIGALRCFTRVKLTKNPERDDWVMVAALVRLPCSPETLFQLHSIICVFERHPSRRCNSYHRVTACLTPIH